MTTVLDLARRATVPSEHDEQVRLFQWAELAAGRYPELREMFAVPNGEHRHKATAGKLRAEGVKAGVEDIVLLVPRGGFHGLLIEMKRVDASPSDVKPDQRAWHEIHRSRGFCVWVCKGFEDARRVVMDYLSFGD
jgi:VRR-NUC domain.